MKILYAAPLEAGSSAVLRALALERLGHELIRVNTDDYLLTGPALLRKIAFRLMAGPHVERLNRDLLALAAEHRPDVFWADKVLELKPGTLDRMRALGIASLSYMIDNFFGPRRDPGWRLYAQDIPHFDLHVTQRDVNIPEYLAAGARDVIKIQTAYEPTLHFPPPPGWSDADRTREVSFVGTPYDERAAFLTRLGEAGLPVTISGESRAWRRALSPKAYTRLYAGEPLYDAKYREAIWRSKINLSFLTHSNRDEFTHKSFEIAGAGGFLLAERTQGHIDRFREGEEAVFFSDLEECVVHIRRYLPDEAARARIAAAGHARAERDGYHNDRQMALVVERLSTILPPVQAAAGYSKGKGQPS
ncbi:Glycosyl transferases group 1 [Granulicella rosea]|uniref:Glycosyl transferases group 1 n=1 Tax=Granulicella rosea TaxID=474952 RepID=A0A239EXQ1_9BACT|nr:glycosyltransferase [Granulicella rosea]SNS48604.1 Glycosyl transferases group 1 [Granulicella rosea]